MCSIEDFKRLDLDDEHRLIVEQELEGWHDWYLPVEDTVLDLGAGCGETAFFYLNHGAKKVICIEANPKAVELLRRNFGDDSRVIIVEAHIGSIKMDIEGSERNMVIETHFPFKLKRIKNLVPPHIIIWKLREDWGNIFTKALRKMRI
jgi:predicted RNA methylase